MAYRRRRKTRWAGAAPGWYVGRTNPTNNMRVYQGPYATKEKARGILIQLPGTHKALKFKKR